MKGDHIGEFEELILLTVGVLKADAYGVNVMEHIISQTGRKVNISAVHSTLRRLESKGFLKSKMSGATAERGGRRKRIFILTKSGYNAAASIRQLRNDLWINLDNLAFE